MAVTHTTPTIPTEWVGVSSRGRTYEVVSCVFFSFAFLAVFLRVYARWTQFRTLFTDDYYCIAAQFFGFVLMALAIILTESYGMGWQMDEVPPAQVERFFQLFYTAEVVYSIISPLYKLAVIFLLRHIFGEISGFRLASGLTAIVSVCWGIAGFFATIFQCSPVEKTWDPQTPGHCFNVVAYILGFGISNLVLDGIILALPLPIIWNLRLSFKRRLAISSLFMLGGVVCLAGILRITNIVGVNLSNATYSLFDIAIWSEIEPALGIVGACVPTLCQFFFSKAKNLSSSDDDNATWLSERRSRAGSRKGDLNDSSQDRHNTAEALTGWKGWRHAADSYAEVESGRNPGFDGPSGLMGDAGSRGTDAGQGTVDTHRLNKQLDFGTEDKSRTIHVNQEISVRYR